MTHPAPLFAGTGIFPTTLVEPPRMSATLSRNFITRRWCARPPGEWGSRRSFRPRSCPPRGVPSSTRMSGLKSARADRPWYQLEHGIVPKLLELKVLMRRLEQYGAELGQSKSRRGKPDYLYVAEIATNPNHAKCESLIATTWNECLGQSPIPFHAPDRRALIDRGRRHRGLALHLEAWEKTRGAR